MSVSIAWPRAGRRLTRRGAGRGLTAILARRPVDYEQYPGKESWILLDTERFLRVLLLSKEPIPERVAASRFRALRRGNRWVVEAA